jgi:hypothetical protein
MDPNSPLAVIRASRRDGKLVFLSDASDSPEEVAKKFMPFRLSNVNSEYEWAQLHDRDGVRTERFLLPSASEQPKKAKSK